MAWIEEIINGVFVSPLLGIATRAIEVLPQLILATVLISVTYVISHLVGTLTKKILYRIRVDNLIRIKDLRDTFGATSMAAIYGHLVKWGLFTIFVVKIIETVSLGFISDAASVLIFWLTRLVFAAIILVTGLVLIDFFTLKILETRTSFMTLVIRAIRAFLIIVLVFTTLEQLGLRLAVAENIFLMAVGAALLAASLAIGIGFGLAIKEDARKTLRRLRKRIK